jgi:hypothetical protein
VCGCQHATCPVSAEATALGLDTSILAQRLWMTSKIDFPVVVEGVRRASARTCRSLAHLLSHLSRRSFRLRRGSSRRKAAAINDMPKFATGGVTIFFAAID